MLSRVDGFIAAPAKEWAYHTKQPLRGITIKWKGETVLLTVKTYNRRKEPIVAFIECSTHHECWEYLYEYMHKFNVPIRWMPDKYA